MNNQKNFTKWFIQFFVFVASSCLSGCVIVDDGIQPAVSQNSNSLAITPLAQQTPVWCWAAVSEMVLRHNQLPNLNPGGNYQCGVVAVHFGPTSPCWSNCFSCVTTIGSMTQLQTLINGYGRVANQLGVASRVLSSQVRVSALSWAEVVTEIDASRAVVAGISPTGFSAPNLSEHVAVVVGYAINSGVYSLIVNDPFPFNDPQFGAAPNPYLAAGGVQLKPGQYQIPYGMFVNALKWANTIYQIK